MKDQRPLPRDPRRALNARHNGGNDAAGKWVGFSVTGQAAPGAVLALPRCPQRTMRWRQLVINRAITCSCGDQFSINDGCPRATSPPTPALADVAADQIPIVGRPPTSVPR